MLSVEKNRQALDPNASRDALGFRALLQPTYYQVFDGVDVTVPIGLGYNFKGRSSAVIDSQEAGDVNMPSSTGSHAGTGIELGR